MSRVLSLTAGALVLLAFVAQAASCGPATRAAEGNQPPLPVLMAPERANAGEPVPVSLADSSDLDGTVVERQMLFGDGTGPAVGFSTLEHTWDVPGVFLIEAYVKDDQGASARARRRIEIVAP